MSEISKVKLMDSGTAMFKAKDKAEATQRLKDVLASSGGSITSEGGCLILDFSTRRYWQFIEARVEETSIPGTFAAVLRTGDAPRLLCFDLPSKKAVEFTKAVLEAL